jgi:hypothetical protein
MRNVYVALFACLVSVRAPVAIGAQALNTVEFLKFCRAPGAQPLRQTIAVVDEAVIRQPTENGSPPDNTVWTRPVLEIADAWGDVATGVMLPGEKFTLYLARGDGSELALAFIGCSPNVDDAERARLEENTSPALSFFLGGVAAQLEKNRREFEDRLEDAIATIVNNAGAREGETVPSAILDALAHAGRLSNLSSGIPRVLVISTFSGVDEAMLTSDVVARKNGLAVGGELVADFQRAEVYVSGVSPARLDKIKPFLEALFLRWRGLLVGVRATGLPPLRPAPASVQVFGGSVDMMEIQAPVQIRIAYDSAGELVNSWIETTTGRSIATPISGRAICVQDGVCTVTGDGQLMGQAWNPDPQDEPVFSPDFAWSGLRYIEIKTNGDAGSVRIWDQKVKEIHSASGEIMEDFRFEVTRTPDIKF